MYIFNTHIFIHIQTQTHTGGVVRVNIKSKMPLFFYTILVNIMNLKYYFSLQFLIIPDSKCSQEKSSFSRQKMCLKNILKLENIERLRTTF